MSLIVDTVSLHLPSKRKNTPSGWISFNAICCHHNGTSADTRQRGGIMINEGISYHCFNCGFKSSWQPGRVVSNKFKKLLRWLNINDDLINKCILEALRLKEDITYTSKSNPLPSFIAKSLPLGSKSLNEWSDNSNAIPQGLLDIIDYITSRRLNVLEYPYYYSNELGFRNRLIIPYFYQKQLVGWTARAINDSKPKYLSEQQPGYVFNLDNQTYNRKYVIVCEGPFDAISIDGVAILGSEISEAQYTLIKQLQKEVIVLADRDKAGMKLVKTAIEKNWSVSFPPWDSSVKDANDAVKKYGKLFTLHSILQNKQDTKLKIELYSKKWFN
jgi:Toprim-like